MSRAITVWLPTLVLIGALLVSCSGDPDVRFDSPPLADPQESPQRTPVSRETSLIDLLNDRPQHPSEPVVPFTDMASVVLKQGHEVWNDRPGIVIFDYDRDGDQDLYITSEGGYPNWLYRNDGDGTFTDWLGPYNSSEEVNVSHSWSKMGRYSVRVKARDEHREESDWSDKFFVRMPICNRIQLLNLIIEFLEKHFPNYNYYP